MEGDLQSLLMQSLQKNALIKQKYGGYAQWQEMGSPDLGNEWQNMQMKTATRGPGGAGGPEFSWTGKDPLQKVGMPEPPMGTGLNSGAGMYGKAFNGTGGPEGGNQKVTIEIKQDPQMAMMNSMFGKSYTQPMPGAPVGGQMSNGQGAFGGQARNAVGLMGSMFGGGAPPPPPAQGQGYASPQGSPMPPYPQPNPATLQPGPWSGWPQNPSQVPPATPAPPLNGGPPQFSGKPQDGYDPNGFMAMNPQEKNQYGGQQIAGAQPGQADYNSVAQYSDAAHQNAMRYLQPQIDEQNRRLQQEMINKGVDPNSPQGQQMAKQLGMQQADAQNAAAFGAMQFGQGIQNQMSQQEQARAQLAGQMQQGLWNTQLGARGQDLQSKIADQQAKLQNANMMNQYGLGMAGINAGLWGQGLNYELGRSGQDLQRYGMDLSNQLGMGQLDLSRQGQNFNQMLGLEGIDFRNRAYNDQNNRYTDQLMMSLLGMNPIPGASQISPASYYQAGLQSAGQDQGIIGALFG